jgi:uncharacterized protein (DUF1684 family)
MKKTLVIFFLAYCQLCFGQKTYKDSLNQYIKDYVANHEVVKGKDKSFFSFYPVSEKYRVKARFEPVKNGQWFSMQTSTTEKQVYRVYGILHFTINDTLVKLNIYQSQDLLHQTGFKDYLFLPFTDATSGEESYGGGRYLDFVIADIVNGTIVLDFNKAYNPYCSYVTGRFSCPIPPRENDLPVAIRAGEKIFEKKH